MAKKTKNQDTDMVRTIISQYMDANGVSVVAASYVIEKLRSTVFVGRLHSKAIAGSMETGDAFTNMRRGAAKMFHDSMRHLSEFVKYKNEKGDDVVERSKVSGLSQNYSKILKGLLTNEWKSRIVVGAAFKKQVTDTDALLAFRDQRTDQNQQDMGDYTREEKIECGKNDIFTELLARLTYTKKIERKREITEFIKLTNNKKSRVVTQKVRSTRKKYIRCFYAESDKELEVKPGNRSVDVQFVDGRKPRPPYTRPVWRVLTYSKSKSGQKSNYDYLKIVMRGRARAYHSLRS